MGMGKSPGHRQHPDHKVTEVPVRAHMTVELDGQTLAHSHDVVRVDESGHPARFYFPRGDVAMQDLQPSATTSECPFKGTARYFSIRTGQHPLDDAVWSYEDPYDEHRGLAGRVAFDAAKSPDLRIRSVS